MGSVEIVLGVMGLVLTLFTIAFAVWAFVVKSAAQGVSDKINSLLSAQEKIDATTKHLDSRIRNHEEKSHELTRDIRHDINHHSNRITKLEAHLELIKQGFEHYKNGTGL